MASRHSLHLQSEGDVLEDRQVRIERIALKDHRDVAISRRDLVDDSFADRDRALADLLQAGDHPKSRRLAASGRPDDDDEFAVTYRKGQVIDGADSIRIDLCDMLKDDCGHRSNGQCLAPEADPATRT
jgi:hypothetical protein